MQRDAQDVALERRDPVHRPALGVPRDQRVELLDLRVRALDQLARERRGLRLDELAQRAARHVTLVERHNGRASLIGPSHRQPNRRAMWAAQYPAGFAEDAEDVVPFRVGQRGARGQRSAIRGRRPIFHL